MRSDAKRSGAVRGRARGQCWGDKHISAAVVHCQDHIEGLAQYTTEWTDGWTENKFSRFRWKDASRGHITYVGDKVNFQNGFGAWRPTSYECDFDPDNNRVLDVRATEGRLPTR